MWEFSLDSWKIHLSAQNIVSAYPFSLYAMRMYVSSFHCDCVCVCVLLCVYVGECTWIKGKVNAEKLVEKSEQR